MYRRTRDIPDISLALECIDARAGYERVVLQAIEDEDFVVEVLRSPGKTVVLVLDPHDIWVEDHQEYAG